MNIFGCTEFDRSASLTTGSAAFFIFNYSLYIQILEVLAELFIKILMLQAELHYGLEVF